MFGRIIQAIPTDELGTELNHIYPVLLLQNAKKTTGGGSLLLWRQEPLPSWL